MTLNVHMVYIKVIVADLTYMFAIDKFFLFVEFSHILRFKILNFSKNLEW
jgi:hypothetical protein